MKIHWDVLFVNGTLVPCEKEKEIIHKGAIAVQNRKIAWMGTTNELSHPFTKHADIVHDLEARCVTPGLIDCHTHLVYAGNRAHEFAMRLEGKTYEDIAKAGGGIQATVDATRAISETDLLKQSIDRAKVCMSHGVTTLEIKSGYGLNWETELKILRVAHQISEHLPLTIFKTFLGAHVIPKEYKGNEKE